MHAFPPGLSISGPHKARRRTRFVAGKIKGGGNPDGDLLSPPSSFAGGVRPVSDTKRGLSRERGPREANLQPAMHPYLGSEDQERIAYILKAGY